MLCFGHYFILSLTTKLPEVTITSQKELAAARHSSGEPGQQGPFPTLMKWTEGFPKSLQEISSHGSHRPKRLVLVTVNNHDYPKDHK